MKSFTKPHMRREHAEEKPMQHRRHRCDGPTHQMNCWCFTRKHMHMQCQHAHHCTQL